jgi:hypothetical protein
MKSERRGGSTLVVEVTNVSPHGFWLFIDNRELFAAFELFPWFREASIADLTRVERPSPHHLYWPALDIDLAVESLEHPERYPLVSRSRSGVRSEVAAVRESQPHYQARRRIRREKPARRSSGRP